MIYKATSRIARWGRLLFLPRFGCSRSHLPDRNITPRLLAGLSLFCLAAVTSASPVDLQTDTSLASAGFYQLNWNKSDPGFQLEESTSADFSSYKAVYQGSDTATVISGKPDGHYYYRISDAQHVVRSNILAVQVKHHSLLKAMLFFLAGAVVFIAMLVLIFTGQRQQGN